MLHALCNRNYSNTSLHDLKIEKNGVRGHMSCPKHTEHCICFLRSSCTSNLFFSSIYVRVKFLAMPHHCTVPGCSNRSGRTCKKGYRWADDGSAESYRLCGSTEKLVGCRGTRDVCARLPFYTFPNPNVEREDLSKRNKALLSKWKVNVKKVNLVVTRKNDCRCCGAHFPALRRIHQEECPSVFEWSTKPTTRRPLKRRPVEPKRAIGDASDLATCAGLKSASALIMECRDSSGELGTKRERQEQLSEQTTVPHNAERPAASTSCALGALCCHDENVSLRNEVMALKAELQQVQQENDQLRAKLEEKTFSARNFRDSDSSIRFYTGLPTYGYFEACFKLASSCVDSPSGRPHALTDEDEFFIALVKLRKDFPEEELGKRAGVSQPTISRCFRKWVSALAAGLRAVPIWPSKEQVQSTMPADVLAMYPRTRVILDAVEIFMEKPANPTAQSVTWSAYKHHNTAKALVGVTPGGAISFVSKLYAGRISDKKLTQACGILTFLDEGDVIMADKGFDIAEDAAAYRVRMNIPPFLHNSQFSEEDLLETRRIASIRIHVERAIEQIKNFRILQCLPVSFIDIADDIWSCCSLLTLCLPALNHGTSSSDVVS